MKIASGIIIVMAVFCTINICAGMPTVQYQVDKNYPPYTFQNKDYLYGFDISLTTLVFDTTEYNVDYSADSWEKVYKRLVNGDIDAGGIIAITDERKRDVLFTKPLFNSYVAIYTLKNANKLTLDDLQYLRVGVGKGYYTETILRDKLAIGTYQAYEQINEALDDLLDGKIDVIFENQQLMDYIIISQNRKGEIIPQVTDLFPREHAYAVSKKRPELVDYMNHRLDQLKENGIFEEVYVRFFYTHSDSYWKSRQQSIFLILAVIVLILAVVLVAVKFYIDHLKKHLKINYNQLLLTHEALEAAEEELRNQYEQLEEKQSELQANEEELVAQNVELQAKEAELFSSRDRYQMLLQQLSEGIIVYAYPSLNIVETNANATRMFGYTEEEFLAMNLNDLHALVIEKTNAEIPVLLKERNIPPEIRPFRHKDRRIVYAEQAASLIEHQGQKLFIFSYRDTTEERKFQEQIRSDVEVAGKVQQAMLPGDYEDEKVRIKTIYEPVHLINGDYYGYKWVRSGNLLNGYILDVTGHGMATALQTAAVSILLNEEMAKNHPWSEQVLQTLNAQLSAYLPENSYAVVLVFSFDFEKRLLTCIAAGINHFIASCQHYRNWVSLHGSFLGNPDFGEFEAITIPLQHGDVFCFATDGLFEGLLPKKMLAQVDFNGIIAKMKALSVREERLDDCTMLCLQVKALAKRPVKFSYSVPEEREYALKQIKHNLDNIIGRSDFWLELALGEAEANACRYGNKVRIKFNKIGKRLIMRVLSDGAGFAGNEYVKKIKEFGVEQTFTQILPNERGRGIPIMLSIMDIVLYNKNGNEVMLIKTLPSNEGW